jgi:hypothetical protein
LLANQRGRERREEGWSGGGGSGATHKWMCGALQSGATHSKCDARGSGATRPATSAGQRRGAATSPRRPGSVAPFARVPHRQVWRRSQGRHTKGLVA